MCALMHGVVERSLQGTEEGDTGQAVIIPAGIAENSDTMKVASNPPRM